MRRLRTWLIVLIGVGVLLGGTWLAIRDGGQGLAALGGGQALVADFYDPVDADTIRVGGITSECGWTRITNVVESVTDVRITVRDLRWPVPCADIGIPIEWTLDLAGPLDDRLVYSVLPEGQYAGLYELRRR